MGDADLDELAKNAKTASLKLRVLTSDKRNHLLLKIADKLESSLGSILEKNAIDVEKAKGQITESLIKRLKLTEGKLRSAIDGIRQISRAEEPIGKSISRTLIMKGLVLEKIAVPIGVLLVIFEARPEALIQIVALAIRSGNGLLLKGGKEATESNSCLYGLISEVVADDLPEIGSGLIGLVQKREDVMDLLQLSDLIDLVIPRGSNQLVSYIKANTKIPVLGHSDGICHVYIDEAADQDKAVKICVDSKMDYPAACNAVETILVHQSLLENGKFAVITRALIEQGIKLMRGQHVELMDEKMDPAPSLSHEYSSTEVTIEVVNDLKTAVEHINRHGSGHTDAIVTENEANAKEFLYGVDSSCVFHNASTRWSDGYRFGLGAEVGISTSRIHARGPVGVEGLMTTKFVLVGDCHLVDGDKLKSEYVFTPLVDGEAREMWRTNATWAIGGFAVAMAASVAFCYLRDRM